MSDVILAKQLNETVESHENGVQERWRDIPGYVGYYRVSDYGRVRSVSRRRYQGRAGVYENFKGRLLKQLYKKPNKYGKTYLRVCLCVAGRRYYESVHHLVLVAFVGPKPLDMWGCHKDDNSSNNHVSNLRWDTPTGNFEDRDANGKTAKGETHYCAKVTETQVAEIRAMKGVQSQRKIGEIFGLSQYAVWAIMNRKSWKETSMQASLFE